jgi:hypothetical protein
MNSTQTAGWSWKAEPELMARLIAAQNKNDHQDILTIVGFFESREQLEAHVVRNEVGR